MAYALITLSWSLENAIMGIHSNQEIAGEKPRGPKRLVVLEFDLVAFVATATAYVYVGALIPVAVAGRLLYRGRNAARRRRSNPVHQTPDFLGLKFRRPSIMIG